MNQVNNNGVPFLDLITPHRELQEELVAIFRTALSNAGFVGGPMVENFEREFAAFCETKHCISAANGTDALRFALMAAGVRQGDAVITVPNTFIATTETISQSGALPEFVEVDEQTYTLDPRKLREYLTEECDAVPGTRRRTSRRSGRPITAVVPVHLYGQMADMDPILEIAAEFDLIVVEDACQAHGAAYFSNKLNRWCAAGSMGTAAAFSFYPGKNLGACGEAGAVTTQDDRIAAHVRQLRDHGQAKKYYHNMEGYNGRLDAIQAGILSVKLKHLARWNQQRIACADEYNRLFSDVEGVVTPFMPAYSRAVYHLYVIRVDDREGLITHLGKAGIGTGIHYPVPLHQQKAYAGLGYSAEDFPVSARVASQIVSLPMYPGLTVEQQERVATEVASFVSRLADLQTV